MTAPFQKEAFVGWTRFRHEDFQCTVLTDGPMNIGSPANGFPKADPREITELLAGAFLATESMTLDQNLLIVNTGQNLVLFDTGCGVNHAFGKSSFGPKIGAEIGRAIPNMRAAGIDPEQIDVVALTHAHPDHCWGLVDDHGNRLYPNARVAISAVDYNYWTDLSRIPEASTQHRKNHFSGAYYNLLPYHDSLIFIRR
jgi:glyoxylase-like metal-dependent hydrolase (beta-lactamase superfamily II)